MAPYDIVLYGATGFTGRLASLYVAKQYGTTIRWAVAGRSKQKLDGIKSECAGHPDVLVADSSDKAAIDAMVASTKVVVTFAGPFARYGNHLVASCVAAGVGYCDITGEMDWVREMIAKHDDAAKQSGARIVHLCGHDSLPWDILTFMLSKKLKEGKADNELVRIDMWDDIKSSASGGTVETALDIMFGEKKPTAPEVQALGYDPLLRLEGGASSEFKLSAKNVASIEKASARRGHAAPRTMFFMAGCNAAAVRRSNALNGYGSKVTYCEGRSFPGLGAAVFSFMGLVLFGGGLYIPPVRWLMRRFFLPKPGEGPSEEYMKSGHLIVTGVATGKDASTAKASIRFPVDPGYMDTARMAVECGLALAFDSARLHSKTGGVYTPGCCQGEVVLERLLKTGTTFEYH